MDELHGSSSRTNHHPGFQGNQVQLFDENVSQNTKQLVQKERRISQRLKNIPPEKRPYYGNDQRKRLDVPKYNVPCEKPEDNDQKRRLSSQKDKAGKKKSKLCHSRKDNLFDAGGQHTEHRALESYFTLRSPFTEHDNAESLDLEEVAYSDWSDYQSFITHSLQQKADAKVKKTMRLFNKYYVHFTQQEEKRCNKAQANHCQGSVGLRNRQNSGVEKKRQIKRPDLKAFTEMSNKEEVLYSEKRIGHLPGITVGYKFFSRAEMMALGLHSHPLSGIDCISKSHKQHNIYGCKLAVAVVLSGKYEDDVDHSDEIVYTGEGGNDHQGNKRQIKDQVMDRGNLALKNNMEKCVPVRVIRGHKSSDSYSGSVYTYCGLFKVVNYWSEKGVSGFIVFKYRLKRLLGQPKVSVAQVHFQRKGASNSSSFLPGLVCGDISNGEESIPIPVTNVIDSPPIAPPRFIYTKSVLAGPNVVIPSSVTGCNCKGKCTNSRTCACARLNGSNFPYVDMQGGRLVKAKDVVYECGPGCGCGSDCKNRISQRGLKYRLEVYRTEKKGWALRSWDPIPSGALVCEYTGVLRRNEDLDDDNDNAYIFDIDCWHTMNGIGGRERREGGGSAPAKAEKADEKAAETESEFCMEAGSCGNVARFINHSCEPNLFVQCVLSSHHDMRLARIVLCAADNIPPMQELTYDYGYALDSVAGPDGKVIQMPCYCGADECRGRLY